MNRMKMITLAILILQFQSCKNEVVNKELNVEHTTGQKEVKDRTSHNKPPASKITPKEAAQYEGDSVTVAGFVADVFMNDKVAYLNFEKKFPKNTFTCVIFEDRFGKFDDIKFFAGKKVEVSGRISIYKNKPQMILRDESQITLAE